MIRQVFQKTESMKRRGGLREQVVVGWLPARVLVIEPTREQISSHQSCAFMYICTNEHIPSRSQEADRRRQQQVEHVRYEAEVVE
jgi:hypothetical protein